MRNAETVLAVIRDRGERGLPLEDIYRQLFNPDLYFRAYGRLYANKGAMTPGSTEETVDGMSIQKIHAIIDDLRHERYRWTPVKRVYIPKRHGKLRPLGLPSWSDKLLQEVVRQILEAYYEPQMSNHSHGFRPGRGCHTALSEVRQTWKGTRWFLEGDITQCFDKLDHTVMLSILGEKLHDNRFLRLIQNMIQAGYLEDWTYHKTLSGSPQGGVVSPILSNIYLDKLDQFVEQKLLPAYTRGAVRKHNNRYVSLVGQAATSRKRGDHKKAKALLKEARKLPAMDTHDADYRRLYYVRYADDTLFGFAGPKEEVEEIKHLLGEFLREELKLELSQEKTLITHATTQAARFLGYDIAVQQRDDKRGRNGRRCTNANIGLRVPREVIEKKRVYYMRKGKPASRPVMMANSDFSIISRYQEEYRGVVQYYLLAVNVCWLHRLHWVMEGSLLRTLANKHKSTVRKQNRKDKTTIETPTGSMKCLQVVVKREDGKKPLVAQFGGIPLRRNTKAVLVDRDPQYVRYERNELLRRLLTDKCEICGSTQQCQVHHIRKLADLKREGRREKAVWEKVMISRRRKTLIVCHECHVAIHAGKPTRSPLRT
jgi:group II intron reverse transcriptase/maturase